MATLTTDINATGHGRGIFARAAAAIGRGLEAHGRKASRRDAIEALEARTDAELARLGLRRADIPMHVFRDLYYI